MTDIDKISLVSLLILVVVLVAMSLPFIIGVFICSQLPCGIAGFDGKAFMLVVSLSCFFGWILPKKIWHWFFGPERKKTSAERAKKIIAKDRQDLAGSAKNLPHNLEAVK